MMLKKTNNKDIDLLHQYYQSTKKTNLVVKNLKIIALPLVLVIFMGGIFGYLKLNQSDYNKQIKEINSQIELLEATQNQKDYEVKYQALKELQSKVDNLKKAGENIASYPEITKQIYTETYKACSGTTINSISFDRETGQFILIVEADFVSQTNVVVKNLKALNIFEQVAYTGYQKVEKDAASELGSIFTTSEKVIVYQMNIICILPGGGSNE